MPAPQRPILPRPAHMINPPGGEGDNSGGGPPGRGHFTLPRSRKNIKAACETCRKSKAKCPGQRPSCSRCEARGLDCAYLTDHAETQVQALKRKYDESQQENIVYRELYRLLVTVSEAEALDILQRLRSGTDVETAVRLAQEGDLLLQLALKPESRFSPCCTTALSSPSLSLRLSPGGSSSSSSPDRHQHPHPPARQPSPQATAPATSS